MLLFGVFLGIAKFGSGEMIGLLLDNSRCWTLVPDLKILPEAEALEEPPSPVSLCGSSGPV